MERRRFHEPAIYNESESKGCKMGWQTDKATGIEWYMQDSDWGCPYSCVAMVLNWVKKKADEDQIAAGCQMPR